LLSFHPLWTRKTWGKQSFRFTRATKRIGSSSPSVKSSTMQVQCFRKRNKGSLSRKFLAKLLKIFRDTSQRAVCCSVKRATSPLFDIPELFHLLFDTPLAARTFKAWLRIIKLIVKTFG